MGNRRAADGKQDATGAPVVLFVNDDLWNCFDQLAAALRRDGVDPVRVVTSDARRGRYVRLVERVLYRGVIVLDDRANVDLLTEMVDDGRVLDVQLNEQMLDGIGVTSPFAELVARATHVPAARRAGWIDKIALSDELRTLGIRVPDQCRADELSTTAAVERFGLPLVLKRRTGTGGTEVRIAHEAEHVEEMLRSLGGPLEHLFYQRYIDGELVGYGAVRSRSGPVQEFTAREHKGRANPLGPTVNVHTTDDERVAAQGRFVLAQLDCGPLAAIEFLEDCDGTLWFIDLSTRAWGNFLSFIGAGLDFPSGYLRVLRGHGPSPSCSRPEPGVNLRVVPAAAEDELRASPAHALLALVRDMRPYRRRLGLRYCVVIALGVLAREHTRRSR